MDDGKDDGYDIEMGQKESIKVLVRVHDQSFLIPCGDGEQDVRWLATVAAQRYRASKRSRGRIRQREMSAGDSGTLLPINVLRKPLPDLMSNVVGPSLKVKDVVADLREQRKRELDERQKRAEAARQRAERRQRAGHLTDPDKEARSALITEEEAAGDQEWVASGADGDDAVAGAGGDADEPTAPLALRVDLRRAPARGPSNEPVQTVWQALAFNYSEPGRARAERLVQEYEAELTERAEAEEARRAAALKQDLEAMERLLSVAPDDSGAQAEAVDHDWPWVRLEAVTTTEDEQTECKRAVLEFFTHVNDLYKHFCGNSLRGPTSAMEYDEWEHVLQVTDSIDVIKDAAVAKRIFRQANEMRGEDAAEDFGEDSMSRFEFLEGLLILAKYKYGRLLDDDGNRLTAGKCFRRLAVEHLVPQADQLAAGPVRKALRDPAVQRHVVKLQHALRDAFDFYARESEKEKLLAYGRISAEEAAEEVPNSVLMSEQEFFLFLEHAGLMRKGLSDGFGGPGGGSGGGYLGGTIGGSQETVQEPLSLAGARQAFAGSQQDEPDGAEGGAATAGYRPPVDSGGMDQLVFHEWIEAVARCGLSRWTDKRVPHPTRIKWALDVAAEVAVHLGEYPEDELEVPPKGYSSQEVKRRSRRKDARDRGEVPSTRTTRPSTTTAGGGHGLDGLSESLKAKQKSALAGLSHAVRGGEKLQGGAGAGSAAAASAGGRGGLV